MEMKKCKVCGRELPETDYPMTKGGVRKATCRECINEKRLQTSYDNSRCRGEITPPISDPEFDNMDIGEVVRLMGRAKKWLESRGCSITLHGEFIETKRKKLKFQ